MTSNTYNGFTKNELSKLLQQSNINLVDDGSFNNGYIYRTGLNKKDWLYNCLCNEINTTKSLNKVYDFLEKAFNPVSFTEESKREKYHTL